MCYFRIMNQLDADMVCTDMLGKITGELSGSAKIVSERICQLANILDTNYGADRGAYSMGGYVLYFPDIDSYRTWIDKVYMFYNINPEFAEYEDVVCNVSSDDMVWKEKLFMLSSDDSITIIFPEKKEVHG